MTPHPLVVENILEVFETTPLSRWAINKSSARGVTLVVRLDFDIFFVWTSAFSSFGLRHFLRLDFDIFFVWTSTCQEESALRLQPGKPRTGDSNLRVKNGKGDEQKTMQSVLAVSKAPLPEKEKGEKQKPSNNTLSDWLPMLPEKEEGEKKRRRKNAHSDWLPMLPEEKEGEKKKRRKNAHFDWLLMLPEEEEGEKKRRRKNALSDWLPMLPEEKEGEKQKMTICVCNVRGWMLYDIKPGLHRQNCIE